MFRDSGQRHFQRLGHFTDRGGTTAQASKDRAPSRVSQGCKDRVEIRIAFNHIVKLTSSLVLSTRRATFLFAAAYQEQLDHLFLTRGSMRDSQAGYPGEMGGANTEAWHTVKLWRRAGSTFT